MRLLVASSVFKMKNEATAACGTHQRHICVSVCVCVHCWEFKPFTWHNPLAPPPPSPSACQPAALPVDYSINLIMRCQSFRCLCASVSCLPPLPLFYCPPSPCVASDSLLLPLNFCYSWPDSAMPTPMPTPSPAPCRCLPACANPFKNTTTSRLPPPLCPSPASPSAVLSYATAPLAHPS